MIIIIKEDYEELSISAFRELESRIKKKSKMVLGLATGSTLLGLYQNLATVSDLDFSSIVTFNLDEYIGIDPNDPRSYNFFMQENLFSKINIPEKNVFIPYGLVHNAERHCEWYEKEIEKRGGIDFQVLGIGGNGHIGFNEPGSSFNSVTRVVDLSEKTRNDNAKFFDNINEVPKQAITMGMKTIMASKEAMLLASGANKAEIIKKALKGPITEDVPASILQNHPNLTVILDKEASQNL